MEERAESRLEKICRTPSIKGFKSKKSKDVVKRQAVEKKHVRQVSKAEIGIIEKDFRSIDIDKSGFVSASELEVMLTLQLGRNPTPREIQLCFSSMDINADGNT